jgi:threonine dehydratase
MRWWYCLSIIEATAGLTNWHPPHICAAVKTGFQDTRKIFEPFGAMAIAGLQKYVRTGGHSELGGGGGFGQDDTAMGDEGASGIITGIGQMPMTAVAITSGANMDFDRLRFVSERADWGESMIAVRMPERPGTFRQLHDCLEAHTVTELSYRMTNEGSASADVILSFRTQVPQAALKQQQVRLTLDGIREQVRRTRVECTLFFFWH